MEKQTNTGKTGSYRLYGKRVIELKKEQGLWIEKFALVEGEVMRKIIEKR